MARAIVDLIEATSEGGKAIAVTGSWGSGKSTVVRLVKQKLQTGKTKVFEFDAWAHRDDPPRRAFDEQG